MDQETKDSLLLHCLSTEIEEIEPARLEGLSGSDWDEVIKQSIRHRVASLLYNRLRTNTHIPAEVVQRLRAIYLQNVVRNTQLYNELSRVLKALKSEDIPIIVLKGAVLAEIIYQNIGLRPMADVDLLVKSNDMWKIDEVLSRLKYKSDIATLYSKRHIKWSRHREYTNKGVEFETHPRLYELPNLNAWVNVSSEKIASVDTFILGSGDFLLHLCLHLDTHLFRTGDIQLLSSWCDIAKILKHYRKELDWDYVIRTAKEHRVEESVHRILRVVDKWFDGRVPADVLNQFRSDGIIISINDILYPDQRSTGKREGGELRSFLSLASEIPSIRGKIYHIFRAIFPWKKFMIHRYSITQPSFVYFYYLVRVCSGVRRVVKMFFQLFGYLGSPSRTRGRKPMPPRSKMEKKV